MIVWQALVMGVTLFVVSKGVHKGLERAVTFLMPGLFVLLLIMVGYAMTTGSFLQGVEFLFKPDFGKLTGGGVLEALGHACFTLSLASGVMIMYGAYLVEKKGLSRPKSALFAGVSVWIVGLGTVMSFSSWEKITINSLTGLN